MDIKTKSKLTFTMKLNEDEMDILSTVLGAAMVYHEDAMDGAAEDALISVMKGLPEGRLFPLGRTLQETFVSAIEGKWQSEEPL